MKEFKHLPGLDLIRVFGILVVVFYHYQVETAVRGLCPADFLPAMEPLVQVAVYTMTLLSGSCLCWQEKSRSWSMKRYLWGRFLAIYPLFWLCFFPIFIYSDIICGNNEGVAPWKLLLSIVGVDGYHLHVVYVPVVEKQILWSKRCKDKSLVGTVKETIMQVSRSKKWESKVALDEQGHPLLTAKGKKVLRASYSVLQDDFFNYMKAAGYTDVERGERGSTEEHLTVTQFKVAQEQQRLETMTAQIAQTEQTLNDTQAAIEKKEKELQSLQKQAKEQHTAALTVQEIRSMGKKTITGNVSFTPSECNILKDYAVTGLLIKAENSHLEEKLHSAQWSAAIWKQRYDALYNAYQELKKEVQPYLDAVKLAPEKVRAFFDAILTRTRQARQPTKPIRRKQDMER